MIDDPPKFWDGDYGCYLVYESDYDALRAERDMLREAFKPLFDAASGLSLGVDWNKGTHAKAYRQKLIDALPAARAALAPKDTGGTKGE